MRAHVRFTTILAAFVLSSSATAQEKLYFNAAMFYATDEGKYDDTKFEQTSLYYHVGLGITLGSGIMLGGKYVQLDEDANDDDDESTNVLTGYGLSIGYKHKSGIGIMGTYL